MQFIRGALEQAGNDGFAGTCSVKGGLPRLELLIAEIPCLVSIRFLYLT